MITTEEKTKIVSKFGRSANDTGSTEVQVAILTTRINNLKPHFEANEKDNHSNRGLLKMIGRRRSLLRYLQGQDTKRYQTLIKELGLRK